VLHAGVDDGKASPPPMQGRRDVNVMHRAS
jgi:hypothetical protein